MANMLIIDDQAWVMDLCRKGLAGEAHQILATYDIEAVSKNIFLFKPSIVFLNQYLKHGFLVWDVLRDIKIQDQNLPLLIVTRHATHLSQADGYVVKSHSAADELRQKVSSLLGRGPAVQKTKEIKKYTITKLVIKNEQH
jgi:DNA-binding NtrC family response regulator